MFCEDYDSFISLLSRRNYTVHTAKDGAQARDILFSLMAQYTPMPNTERFPELQKTVTAEGNDALVDYMTKKGIYNGFWQEPCSATDDMIPDFDLTGV